MELEKIKSKMLDSELPLQENAKNLVFGEGKAEAGIVVIGEAPGAREDELGKPFVGRAGKRLDEMLNLAGLDRTNVYITNIVKYRPPDNRNPRVSEIRAHSPFLVEQIKSINPKVIVTLGNFSSKFILAGCDLKKMKNVPGISLIQSKPHNVEFDGFSFTVVPLYHPAATLYNPNLKDDLKKGFEIVRELSKDE